MKCLTSRLSLVAALLAVRGVAFPGPAQTAASLGCAQEETPPSPTTAPSIDELKKRQLGIGPETCGWVNGDYLQGVTCPGSRTCMLLTSATIGVAGCCDGSDLKNCGWAASCIDADAYSSGGCGADCLSQDFVVKCTAASSRYCLTWKYAGQAIFDYGCGTNSNSRVSTIFQIATDASGATISNTLPTVVASAPDSDPIPSTPSGPIPSTPGSGTTTNTSDNPSDTSKRLAIGVIVGIVIVGLFLLFCIAIAILFCIKKKRKQRLIAASTQAMAAVHATRPQSQYPPPQQQQQPQQQQYVPMQAPLQQPSLFQPSGDPQNSVPITTSHFTQGKHEEKPNVHTSVHEYVMTPISNPSSPAPVYSQLHNVPPPMPVVSQYQASPDAHEVDAVSVPHAPNQAGPVHEMGHGK